MRKYRVLIDPLSEFSEEIENIQHEREKHIASSALLQLPDYFWTIPASSSGKYHPKTSLGLSGLVRHTKSISAVGESLLRNPIFAPFDDLTKDRIRIALMLHDGFKQGLEENGHTAIEHPLLLRHNIDPVLGLQEDHTFDKQEILESWNIICDMVETHMGVWNKDRTGKEVLPIPKTDTQKFVHLCDYIASRKNITVDVYDTVSIKANKDWRDEPATLVKENGELRGQIPYMEKLYLMCKQKGIHIDPITYMKDGKVTITKGQASDLISELKKKLGLT